MNLTTDSGHMQLNDAEMRLRDWPAAYAAVTGDALPSPDARGGTVAGVKPLKWPAIPTAKAPNRWLVRLAVAITLVSAFAALVIVLYPSPAA